MNSGIILFTVAAATETTLTILQLVTKTPHTRKRCIVSLAGACLFTMLLVVRVLEWGPRYYAITVFLLIAVITALIRLIGPSKNQSPSNRLHRPIRILFRWLGMMLLLILVCLPAILFPQYQPIQPSGPYSVSIYQTTWIDEDRTDVYTDAGDPRLLNLAFWYPDDALAAQSNVDPLIVFSHGGLGVKTSNESLYLELASHGYVVVSIDHTYQSFFTTDEHGKTHLIRMDYMQELQSENARLDPQRSYELYQKWLTIRTDDINFTIDHILSERDQPDAKPVYQKIDPFKIGVMGHSLGGSAALAMGRIRDDLGAVIALEAPFLWDIEGVASGQFIWNDEPYPVPVLNLYSDSSWYFLSEWPQYRANDRMRSNNTDRMASMHLAGAGHLGMTDLALSSPVLTRILDGRNPNVAPQSYLSEMNRICLEFFDSHLR